MDNRLIRVLVADDSPAVLEAICDFLESHGKFKIVGMASDGIRLLEEAARVQPDLVITDFKMSLMNGLHAARELRRSFPDLRVVILSGLDSHSIQEECALSGADSFVEKSAMPDKLIPKILRLFSKAPNSDSL
jgi:DNA-binding NarL/FixJ family response regulator